MLMTLSMCSMPSIPRCWPGMRFAPCSSAWSAFERISWTSDDFPLPDTPVTATNRPSGNSTSMSCRLFSPHLGPRARHRNPTRRSSGTTIERRPAR